MGEVTQMATQETIKITGKDVLNPAMVSSFRKLCSFDGFNPKVAYNISYISRKVEKFMVDIREQRVKIVEKFAEKNEDGTIKYKKNGNASVPCIPDDKEDDLEKAMQELLEIDHEIRKRPLDVLALAGDGYKFTPNDISALEPLLCGLED